MWVLWSAVTCYRFRRPRLVAAREGPQLGSSRRQVAVYQSADKSAHSKISPRQRLRHTRQRIRERRDQRAVLLQLSRINFVERVRGGVMIIKVSARVLNRRERRHAGFTKRGNVSPDRKSTRLNSSHL